MADEFVIVKYTFSSCQSLSFVIYHTNLQFKYRFEQLNSIIVIIATSFINMRKQLGHDSWNGNLGFF